MTPELTSEDIAELLYDTYCENVGGVAFNGDKLPTWDEFAADDSKKKQANAWRAVAKAARYGCPECRCIDPFVYVCDEPGCDEECSCGTPTEKGYRMTCSKHAPVKHGSNRS